MEANREKLLSLWQGAFGTIIKPRDKEVLFGWAVEVVIRSMKYYDAEVADCGDTDCPVCCTMIELGEVLGGLVRPIGEKHVSEMHWKAGLTRRMGRIRDKSVTLGENDV